MPPQAVTARPAGAYQYKENTVIYFIQDTAGNIKIGHANNVQGRFRSLQTAHAHKLRLLATIPGSQFDERRLHKRFAAHRLGGEWFRPAPELLAFIGAPEQVAPAPPAPPRKRGPLFPISKDEPAPLALVRLDEPAPYSPFAGLLPALLILSLALFALFAMGVF
jgi:hypothetical protein